MFGSPSKIEKLSAVDAYWNFITVGDLVPGDVDIKFLQHGTLGGRILPLLNQLGFKNVSESIKGFPNIRDLYIAYLPQNEDYERTVNKEEVKSQISRNSQLINEIRVEQSKLGNSIDMKKHTRRQSLSNPILSKLEEGRPLIMLQEDYPRARRKSLDIKYNLNNLIGSHIKASTGHIFTGLEFELACITEYAQNSPAEFYKDHKVVAIFEPKEYFQEALETDAGNTLEYVTSPRYIKKDDYLERVLYICVLVYIWIHKEIFGYAPNIQQHKIWHKQYAKNDVSVRGFTDRLREFFSKYVRYNLDVVNEQALNSKIKPVAKSDSGAEFQFNLSSDTIPVNIKGKLFTNTKKYYPNKLKEIKKVFPMLDDYVLLGIITYISQIPYMILEVIHSESTDTKYTYRNYTRALNILAYYVNIGLVDTMNLDKFTPVKISQLHKKMINDPEKFIYEKDRPRNLEDIYKTYGNTFFVKTRPQQLVTNGYVSAPKDYNHFWLKCSLAEFLKQSCNLHLLDNNANKLKGIAIEIIKDTKAYKLLSELYEYSKYITMPECSVLKSDLKTIINNMIELLVKDIDTFASFDKNKYYKKELGQLKRINEYKTIGARQDTYIKSDNIVMESRAVSTLYKQNPRKAWFHDLMDKVSQSDNLSFNTYDEIINYVNELDSDRISAFKSLLSKK
ncbi:hypothetical protein FRA_48c13520 [Francisella sp. W12-1067]|nr:hypothetical protein FRA_48c13520 [Francisella sp. W12-1067]